MKDTSLILQYFPIILLASLFIYFLYKKEKKLKLTAKVSYILSKLDLTIYDFYIMPGYSIEDWKREEANHMLDKCGIDRDVLNMWFSKVHSNISLESSIVNKEITEKEMKNIDKLLSEI